MDKKLQFNKEKLTISFDIAAMTAIPTIYNKNKDHGSEKQVSIETVKRS